jgi:hypothetical protein
MASKKLSARDRGWTEGIGWAIRLCQLYGTDAKLIFNESCISKEEFKKYCDPGDWEYIKEVN